MEKEYLLPSRYKIKGTLGQGTAGAVYNVHDSLKNINLALKILNNIDKDSSKTIEREFSTLSSLDNTGLVKVFDFGLLKSGVPYFTMELLDGDDLRSYLSKEDNIKDILQILINTLEALYYLHQKNIIHGDIKPENIFVTKDESGNVAVKLLDFGLATSSIKKKGAISGTPRFLAPETINDGIYSESSDLYAFGMTIIECVIDSKVNIAHKLDEGFYDSAYRNLSNNFKAANLDQAYSIALFILDLCRLDKNERIESSKGALDKLNLLISSNDQKVSQLNLKDIIGRKEELDYIEKFIKKDAFSGKTLILKGDRGVGKKRLIKEALRIAQIRGNLVLDLSAEAYQSESFNKCIETLSDNLPPEDKNQFISNHLKIQDSIVNRFKTNKLESKEDVSVIIYDNVIQFIHKMSKTKPVLITIPDIYRFSTEFLQFVNHMAYEIDYLESDIRLIISRNSDVRLTKMKEKIYRTMVPSSPISTIDINELNIKQTKSLLKSALGTSLFSDHEIDEIFNRTGGNPFFIVEILKNMIERGVLGKTDVSWHLNRIAFKDYEIPGKLEEIAASYYNELSRKEKNLLQTVSITEKGLTIDNISEIASTNINDIRKIIENLRDQNLIKYSGKNINIINPILREHIRNRISWAKNAKLNNSIATILEREGSEDIQLAKLFIKARNTDKAFEYGIRAARKLNERFEIFGAFELLNKLLKLAKRKGNKYYLKEILDSLAPIELQVGLTDKSKNHYRELIELSDNPREKGLYNLQLAYIFDTFLGNKGKAKNIYEFALKLSELSYDNDLKTKIFIKLAEISEEHKTQILEKAVCLSEKSNIDNHAIALSELIFAQQMTAENISIQKNISKLNSLFSKINVNAKKTVLSNLSAYHFFRGNYKKAEDHLSEKLSIEEKTNDIIGRITTLRMLGGIHYIQGNFPATIETQKKAINIAGKYKKIISLLTIYSNISLAYIHLSEYFKALEKLKEGNSLIVNHGIKKVHSLFTGKFCEIYLTLGEKAKTDFKKYYNLAESNAISHKNKIRLGHTRLYMSRFYYQRLQLAKSSDYSMQALGLFKKADDRDDIVEALIHISKIHLEKHNNKGAADRLKEAREIYDEINCKYLEAQLLLAEGSLARHQESKDAERILNEALKISRKMGTRETTWQIYRELGLLYKNSGNISKALSSYRDSIETIRQITESIDGDEYKTSYLSLPFRKRVFDEVKELKD